MQKSMLGYTNAVEHLVYPAQRNRCVPDQNMDRLLGSASASWLFDTKGDHIGGGSDSSATCFSLRRHKAILLLLLMLLVRLCFRPDLSGVGPMKNEISVVVRDEEGYGSVHRRLRWSWMIPLVLFAVQLTWCTTDTL